MVWVSRNQFEEDATLQRVLKRYLLPHIFAEISADLHAFGQRVVSDIAYDAELTDRYPLKLVHLRPWGHQVDEIQVHEAWDRLHDTAASEGLIAIGYERCYQGISHSAPLFAAR